MNKYFVVIQSQQIEIWIISNSNITKRHGEHKQHILFLKLENEMKYKMHWRPLFFSFFFLFYFNKQEKMHRVKIIILMSLKSAFSFSIFFSTKAKFFFFNLYIFFVCAAVVHKDLVRHQMRHLSFVEICLFIWKHLSNKKTTTTK